MRSFRCAFRGMVRPRYNSTAVLKTASMHPARRRHFVLPFTAYTFDERLSYSNRVYNLRLQALTPFVRIVRDQINITVTRNFKSFTNETRQDLHAAHALWKDVFRG